MLVDLKCIKCLRVSDDVWIDAGKEELPECEHCGGEMQKVISASGLQFGPGFFNTGGY